jgi:hypothetical protein
MPKVCVHLRAIATRLAAIAFIAAATHQQLFTDGASANPAALSGHPKAANEGHLKTGQRE